MKSAIKELLGVLLGIAAGWGISAYYYDKSGKDLAREAAELRKLNTIMLNGMEQNGWVKLNRDQNGNITGMQFQMKGDGKASAVGSGELTVHNQ